MNDKAYVFYKKTYVFFMKKSFLFIFMYILRESGILAVNILIEGKGVDR